MTICMSRKYTDKCFETVPNINMVTSSPCRSTSLWRRWRRMTLPMRLEIINNDQIHFTWYLSKCGLFDDRDMDGLEVLDDFKMLNMVHHAHHAGRHHRGGGEEGRVCQIEMDIIRQQVWSIDDTCWWRSIDDTCWWRSIGAFKYIRMHIIIKQEGDKNEVE